MSSSSNLTYKSKILLNGKTIVITGACGLLGKEITKAVLEFEGNVVIADINYDSAAKFSYELKEKYKSSILPISLDITSEESVQKMIEFTKNELGSIDGLVNSAYPRNKKYGTSFENVEFDSWKENVDLHLNGYFNVTQKVSKVIIEQRSGCIINMSSIYGILGSDPRIYEGTKMNMPPEYSAIKGGITNFTRYLSTYLAKYNIRVNSVTPGGIFDNQPNTFVEKYSYRTPMGRMGNPDEIAGGIVFLLSDLASYITGQNLIIDGGWSAW